VLIAGGAALVGLAAGLLVWAPWNPPPQTPTALRVSSPTATTALVSWTAPKGGASPSRYDIFRDGKQFATVPGARTSWTDTGLAVGSKHSYAVITEGNGQKSAPTARVEVTTIVPAPVAVTKAGANYTTVKLRWSPPPNAPTPDSYLIEDMSVGQPVEVGSVTGTVTSYTATELVPGDDYSFAVAAIWGAAKSGLSTTVDAPPMSPPLSGDVPVNLRVTTIETGSTGLKVGDTFEADWNVTANCAETSCTLTDKGSLDGSASPFTMKMSPSKGGYQGQAHNVQFGTCIGVKSFVTVTLHLYPDSGGVTNGAWTSWNGELTLAAAYQAEGNFYCPAGDWAMAVTNSG
jgi:hypothetical protein